MIIITCHGRETNGEFFCALLDRLVDNLSHNKKDFIVVKHYIFGEKKPEVEEFIKGNKKISYSSGIRIRFSILRYVYEIFYNLKFIFHYRKDLQIYIGIDPLNSLSGVLGKKLIKYKNVFYTPDYSPQKFKNKFLNSIYHKIDRYCCFQSDIVWNVSTRIQQIRKEMGLESEKNIFLPNSPGFVIENDEIKKNKFHLITSGNLRGQLENNNIILAIKKLKKTYNKIHFFLAGDGPMKASIEKLILENNLGENVTLLGKLEYKEYLEYVRKCGVGIAMYNGTHQFNYYGDSTKCREFMYFGLPVLTSSFHSTADEIQQNKAGIIDDEMSIQSYTENIKKLFETYDEYSNNSKKLGVKNNTIYTKIIGSL